MSYESIGCYVLCNFRLTCVSLHDALCRMNPLGVMSYESIGCYVLCNFRLTCVSLHDALCRMNPLGVIYCSSEQY